MNSQEKLPRSSKAAGAPKMVGVHSKDVIDAMPTMSAHSKARETNLKDLKDILREAN